MTKATSHSPKKKPTGSPNTSASYKQPDPTTYNQVQANEPNDNKTTHFSTKNTNSNHKPAEPAKNSWKNKNKKELITITW